jgi:hypothetical protein
MEDAAGVGLGQDVQDLAPHSTSVLRSGRSPSASSSRRLRPEVHPTSSVLLMTDVDRMAPRRNPTDCYIDKAASFVQGRCGECA